MEYQFSDVCLLGGCTSVAMDSESKQRLSSKSTTLTNAVRTIVKIFNSISHKISKYSTFSSQKILCGPAENRMDILDRPEHKLNSNFRIKMK